MSEIILSMKLTQKQAGALYLKSVKLERQVKALEAERGAMAAKAAALDALIVAMQARAAAYIEPDGESDDTFISAIIGLLDGPEQRAAQATPAQCLANVRAEAGRTGFIAGYMWHVIEDHDDVEKQWAGQESELYAEQIRQGGE